MSFYPRPLPPSTNLQPTTPHCSLTYNNYITLFIYISTAPPCRPITYYLVSILSQVKFYNQTEIFYIAISFNEKYYNYSIFKAKIGGKISIAYLVALSQSLLFVLLYTYCKCGKLMGCLRVLLISTNLIKKAKQYIDYSTAIFINLYSYHYVS